MLRMENRNPELKLFLRYPEEYCIFNLWKYWKRINTVCSETGKGNNGRKCKIQIIKSLKLDKYDDNVRYTQHEGFVYKDVTGGVGGRMGISSGPVYCVTLYAEFEVYGGIYSYEKIQDCSGAYDYSWRFYGAWWNFCDDTSIAYRS